MFEEEKVVGTHRLVTIHGDSFICFTPQFDHDAKVVVVEGYHVIGNSWYGGGSKKRVEVPALAVRYIERGEYRFGQPFTFEGIPPLPRP